MTEIYQLFLSSKNFSSKYKKYFPIYEDLFKKFNSGISENIRNMRYEEYSLFNIYFSKIRKFIIEKIKHLK